MRLTEEEVYNGAKRWLQQNGYIVLAGQPARGVDHLPVIEIKLPSGDKGSRDAYKPDLLAFRDGIFYIIECKPAYNDGDRLKVLDVLRSDERLRHLYHELRQYRLLQRVGYEKSEAKFLQDVDGILAFSGAPCPTCELHQLIVADWKGHAALA